MIEHDPNICFCGIDEDCRCQCERCLAFKGFAEAAKRRGAIIEKFSKSGMDIHDLADVIWMDMEQEIEARIETLANEAIQRALRGITLTSIVSGGITKE